jgi:asparagine synthase (glutamine-hydrolysing)
MCGIAGIINLSGEKVNPSEIEIMLDKIKHRGPDDEGTFFKDNAGFGHVRLSIIDLSAAGHQPMFSTDERFMIIFNGEIYNYLELRKELESLYPFKSKTDTEVLLAAYIHWGEDCLHKLNGDFAFVIYDTQTKTVFGARDRFGIKPFYYYLNSEQFVFASEIKAVLPLLKDVKPNNKSIFEYLAYNRCDQSNETFFDSIFKIPHGHRFTLTNGKLSIKRWYHLEASLNYPTPSTPEAYRKELQKSVQLRLRSDVPIGVCLSGGIDSSTLTSILYNDFNLKELKTFSGVFEKGHWADESKFINAYNGKLKNMHFVTPTGESFYNEFEQFITSQCEPMPSVSPYAQYKVMQLAKGNVVVTLDGQGADEMLGGYTYFYGSYFKELLKRFQLASLIKETISYNKKNLSKEGFTFFMYYLLPLSLKKYAGRKKYGSLQTDFYSEHVKNSTISEDLYNPNTMHESFLQHFEYKLEHLLKWDDLNSMSFSIESRVPFLDHNLVETTLSLPNNHIIKDGVTKHILREAVKDILPAEIYNRSDKRGFETPSDEWFRVDPFKGYIAELLNSTSFKNRGYFDIEDCKRKFQKHLDRKANLSNEIWKWINLEVWFRKFIDKKI